jgi:peptide/nickel transport system permease protein
MPETFRRYVGMRAVYLLVTIFLILSFNFLLFRVMPGDITKMRGVSEETGKMMRDYYGLNSSLPVQYLNFIEQTLTGHLGKSLSYRKGSEVSTLLGPPLTNTLILVGSGTFISILAGIYLGRVTAWHRGKSVDKIGSGFFLIFYCMPTFLFALVLLQMFAVYVPNWPVRGATGPDYEVMDIVGKLEDRALHTILPLFALVIESIAAFSIITRSSLIDVMTEEYMVTAVAKGLTSRKILNDHAMPNAMLPVVTVVAMNVGWILSGSIMIEVIFSYQGLGFLTYKAVLGYDYPLLQAAFMLEAVAVVLANFIADLMLFKLDPRVKL